MHLLMLHLARASRRPRRLHRRRHLHHRSCFNSACRTVRCWPSQQCAAHSSSRPSLPLSTRRASRCASRTGSLTSAPAFVPNRTLSSMLLLAVSRSTSPSACALPPSHRARGRRSRVPRGWSSLRPSQCPSSMWPTWRSPRCSSKRRRSCHRRSCRQPRLRRTHLCHRRHRLFGRPQDRLRL